MRTHRDRLIKRRKEREKYMVNSIKVCTMLLVEIKVSNHMTAPVS